jgi:hypothetical protein
LAKVEFMLATCLIISSPLETIKADPRGAIAGVEGNRSVGSDVSGLFDVILESSSVRLY